MIRSTLTVLLAAALSFASVPAFAVPEFLQYQGRLTDAAGAPLTGPVDVTFTMYTDEDGDESLWSQTFDALTLDNGRFSVLLGGSEEPFTEALMERIAAGEELYLGIQVGEDPEMTPRQPIASVVYALHAGSAGSGGSGDVEHAATADTAEFAFEAESALEAEHAAEADTAEFASEAESALEAEHAAEADTAEFASEAESALEAEHAATADTAEFAAEAEHAATADEVEGMPGLAFMSVHRVEVEPLGSTSVVSVTIETPVDGYVLVTGGGTLVLDNTDGNGARGHANVGEEEDGIPEFTMGLVIGDLTPEDVKKLHYIPFQTQRVYQKPAGEHTFHLNVRNNVDERPLAVNRPSITAVFLRHGYGTAEIQAPVTAPESGTR